MASSEASYPTANGKRFTLDVDTDADVPPYQDWAHTDRLDNFTVMEVDGKAAATECNSRVWPTRSHRSGCTTC